METKFPIGRLNLPEKITEEVYSNWLHDIQTYTNRLKAVVGPLTDKELAYTYRPGAWNIRQLVHHITDSQLVMFQRLKLALTDDEPTVPNFIQDEWARQADTLLPVNSSIQILEGLNTRIVALASSLNKDDWKRTFIHEQNGEIDVLTKIAKLCWHEEHHLAHINIALEKQIV